jgi:integrase
MSVYKPTDGSDYVIDREFLMDGQSVRIKASSWTGQKREALIREGLLVELHRAGRFAMIRALKAGEITVLDLVAAKEERRLYVPDALREITDRRSLWDVLGACIELGTAGEKTKKRYRLSLTKLKATGALGETATIRTLQAVNWSALKAQWSGSASDWNHMVRMLSHALTLYYGDVYATERRQIVAKIPKAKEPRSRLAVLSLDLFRRMVAKAPAIVRPTYWTLLLTGMRAGDAGEYFQCTAAHLDAAEHLVHVPGTKTVGSRAAVAVHPDDWHWIEAGIPAPRQYKWVRLHWKRAARACGRPEIRLHDIRHLSIRLALDGGAPLADVQAHARHEDPTMTMDYARIESSRRAADAIRKALVEG